MNDQLQQFARQTLLDGLGQLPEEWQRIFKLMYGRGGTGVATTRTLEETEQLSIEQVVSEVKPEQLDWAMTQVENSLTKISRAKD